MKPLTFTVIIYQRKTGKFYFAERQQPANGWINDIKILDSQKEPVVFVKKGGLTENYIKHLGFTLHEVLEQAKKNGAIDNIT